MPKTNKKPKTQYVWALLRITIGLIFLWAFADKLLGLGFATCRVADPTTSTETVTVLCEKAVIKGGSATEGFLKFGTKGPLKDFYAQMAGNAFVDILFMGGLLLIGLSLVSGIGVGVACASAILLLLMMWSATLWPANNPIIDEHIIYALALVGIFMTKNQPVLGLGAWWQRQAIVKKYPILA